MLVPQIHLGVVYVSRNHQFDFREVWAKERDLVAVYAVDRGTQKWTFVVIFDLSSGAPGAQARPCSSLLVQARTVR